MQKSLKPSSSQDCFIWDPRVKDKCGQAIVICGAARSGTTILGKIINSFEGVEYEFEPPIMFALYGLIQSMEPSHWKIVYENYLYETILINGLAGRHINLNPHDDSSILNVKSREELHERHQRSLGKVKAVEVAESHTIAYKMPDVMPFLPKLLKYYPATRLIITIRKPHEVIHSILKKGWFKDDILQNGVLDWPFRSFKDKRVPYWVPSGEDENWLALNELDKIAYYYMHMLKPLQLLPSAYKVYYDKLIQFPEETVRALARQFGLKYGHKTKEIIKQVDKRVYQDRDPNILERVSDKLRADINCLCNELNL